MSKEPVTACALIIGNEILSGRTQDVNLAFLGRRLNEVGIRLMEARIIPDVEAVIVAAVNEVRRRFDYVFTTGGIGPTHDDITAASIAKAFGVSLVLNPEAHARLQAHYGPGELNEARLRMAHAPEGAVLIDNPISIAPGFQMENVFVMAGIPTIMQAMFEGIVHRLAGGVPLRARSFTLDMPEGAIARELGQLQEKYSDVEIGSYPFSRQGRFGTRLVLRTTDEERLAAAARDLDGIVARLGGSGTWDPDPACPPAGQSA
ncbi:MAG: competence/damage-inducible protein A [Alphaproteobacteria bacterium]|nr:MAG: competence/damage-inducible protein A [Alphaproteobacteria bacterium]